MSQIQLVQKKYQDSNKINWKAVHLNRELVNGMIKKSEKNKKYCTLSQDFFSPTPQESNQQSPQKYRQQEFGSPTKVKNNQIEQLVKSSLQKSRGIFYTPQQISSRRYEQHDEELQSDQFQSIQGAENLEKNRCLYSKNVNSANEQTNKRIQFNRLFKMNKTFVELKNLSTKRKEDENSLTQRGNEKLIQSIPQNLNTSIETNITKPIVSPLKKVRKHTKTFDNSAMTLAYSNTTQSMQKQEVNPDGQLDQKIRFVNFPQQARIENPQYQQNDKFNISQGIQNLPSILQSYSLQPSIRNQINNFQLNNKSTNTALDNTKGLGGILKNLDQLSSTRSSQRSQFPNKQENFLRVSRQNSCINILERSQKYQLPQSLNLIGNSFDESINITDTNNYDPSRIKSLQNIDFLMDKNKTCNVSDGESRGSPQKQKKKILFHQSSLNYLDGYLTQARLYRESNQKDDVINMQKTQNNNKNVKYPSQSMQNIINRCFLNSNKYPTVTIDSIQNLKDNNSQKTQKLMNNKFKSSINLKMDTLSNIVQIGGSMNKIDFDPSQKIHSPLISPLTERKVKMNESRKESRLLLQEGTKKENSLGRTNALSCKITKQQSIINSPALNRKDSTNLTLLESCFGSISQLNTFLDQLQGSYEERAKQNYFEFINQLSIRFNESPLKDFIYLSIGAPIKSTENNIQEQKQQIKQKFKVIGINYWEFKEIKKFILNLLKQDKILLEEDRKMLKSQFQQLDDEIFKWRIYDELERYTVADIVYKIQEQIEQDSVTQQILSHFSFIHNSAQFEQLLAFAFTSKCFSSYESLIRETVQPLNWTYADIMCVKLSIFKIFSRNFKFSQLSMVNFLDQIERMRYIATKQPDFFIRLQEKDNDYQNFFSTVNRLCLQYLLAFQSSKDPNNIQSGYIINQQFFFSQQAQSTALQNNIWIEVNLLKFIQNLFFGSLEISLFEIVKNEKYDKIISVATFPQIEKFILNQLEFYVCPNDYLLEIKKKLRLIKIQLGLKSSFEQQLFNAFQSSSSNEFKNKSLKKGKQLFYKHVISACSMNQTFNNQNILGKEGNIKIFAVTLINFIFDTIVEKNFPAFVSIYDCLAYSKVFNVSSFYYEEFAFVLKTVIVKIIDSQEYAQKFIKRIEKSMSVLIEMVSQFE